MKINASGLLGTCLMVPAVIYGLFHASLLALVSVLFVIGFMILFTGADDV